MLAAPVQTRLQLAKEVGKPLLHVYALLLYKVKRARERYERIASISSVWHCCMREEAKSLGKRMQRNNTSLLRGFF